MSISGIAKNERLLQDGYKLPQLLLLEQMFLFILGIINQEQCEDIFSGSSSVEKCGR